MGRLFSVTIPVKPYIKRYLEKRYGTPITVSRLDIVGNKLFDIVKRKFMRETGQEHAIYTEQVTIYMSKFISTSYGWELSEEMVVSFNSFMEFLIKDQMRTFLTAHQNRMQIKDAVMLFMETFGFGESDFSYEAIIKDWYRYRKRNGMEIFEPLPPKKIYHSNVRPEKFPAFGLSIA